MSTINNFGPYVLRYSTAADAQAVVDFVVNKSQAWAGLNQSSKTNAVYERATAIMEQTAERGLYVILERVATTEEVAGSSGSSSKLVGITGGYLLGEVDDQGLLVPMPIQRPNGTLPVTCRVGEIGTSIYAKNLDTPNGDGLLPTGCFYDVMVAGATLKLFAMAAQQITGVPKIEFDVITANVQTRLTPIIARLTGKPHQWNLIARPSDELIAATSNTIPQDPNFATYDKHFFQVTPDKLPGIAAFFLKQARSGQVAYKHDEHGSVRDLASVRFDMDDSFMELLKVISDNQAFFNTNRQAGMADVRRRLDGLRPAPRRLPSSDTRVTSAAHFPVARAA